MLIRLLGCLCILGASAAWGLAASKREQKKVEEVEQLEQIIWQLCGEIGYTRAPLGEILGRVGKRCPEPYRTWIQNIRDRMDGAEKEGFAQMWREQVEQDLQETLLAPGDRAELASLGTQMGYLDPDMLKQVLEWYVFRLKERRGQMMQGLKERQRLCTLLGVAGGLFLVILFI